MAMTIATPSPNKILSESLLYTERDVKSGQEVMVIRPHKLFDVATTLKNDLLFDVLIDLAALDYKGQRDLRFELNYFFYSSRYNKRVQLKTQLVNNEKPEIDSVSALFGSANWLERECFDLMGITFTKHLDLKRLFLWDEFEGHPLRKDFGIHQKQTTPPNKTALSKKGFTHRAVEKHAEGATYAQFLPFSERLNGATSFMHSTGYCHTIETLMGIAVPERALFVRILLCELTRMTDHLVCLGHIVASMNNATPLNYALQTRGKVTAFFEKISGSRVMHNLNRIGGLVRDLPSGFDIDVKAIIINDIQATTNNIKKLIEKNTIFVQNTRDVGIISRAQALDFGLTGPCLRASGVVHDLRKIEPHTFYSAFDFEVPIGQTGDAYDRVLVRFEEITQSLRIMDQCLKKIPRGPVMTSDARVALPLKEEIDASPEALNLHTKLILEGILPLPGEIYSRTETANGELGFFIVSDGNKTPYRLKIRTPSFFHAAAAEKILANQDEDDAAVILASLNICPEACGR